MSRMAFYVDSSVCIGCRACEIACKDEKQLGVGPRLRYVRDRMGGSWTVDENDPTVMRQDQNVYSYHVSISCNHCATPACQSNCPVDAISKDEETGIVTIDAELCNGCGICTTACPYGAPQMVDEDMKAVKCDFCRQLQVNGAAPACVETCPMRALDYGDYDELVAKYGNVRDMIPLPSSESTDPSLIVKAHPAAESAEASYSTSLYVTNR